MKLLTVLNPWGQISRLKAQLADVTDRLGRAKDLLAIRGNQVEYLEKQVAKFDGDGDGKIGGSKKKAPK